ncbi:ankyrin repeat-containing domain protein [Mycena amicta]|nr:ankyrin repeat-containing domain protein [Mycena amicta]
MPIHSLPPELILATSNELPTGALNCLTRSSRQLHTLLQPELEARLTPQLAEQLLYLALRRQKPHIVAKLLAPPHSLDPDKDRFLLAAQMGDIESTRHFLEAGADPSIDNGEEGRQSLHQAVIVGNVELARILLEYGAKIEDQFGCDGKRQNSLHWACHLGHMEMAQMLLDEYRADLEAPGHFGTPLGFAMRAPWRRLEMVRFLLMRRANAAGTVPLFILLDGPPPLHANLVYIALDLKRPVDPEMMRWYRERKNQPEPVKWEGLPLTEEKKTLIAMLLKAGASREETIATVQEHLTGLAEAAFCTEKEFMETVEGMLKEAEDYLPLLAANA